MPRRKYRRPRPRNPGELRLRPGDIPTAEESMLLAGKVVEEYRWTRRLRRWFRRVLRELRGPR